MKQKRNIRTVRSYIAGSLLALLCFVSVEGYYVFAEEPANQILLPLIFGDVRSTQPQTDYLRHLLTNYLAQNDIAPADGYAPYQVGQIKVDEDWAFANLISSKVATREALSDLEQHGSPPNVKFVVLNLADQVWVIYVEGTPKYDQIMSQLPASMSWLSQRNQYYRAASSRTISRAVPALPYALNSAWRFNQGPNPQHAPTESLDFGVVPRGTSGNVHAMDSGRIIDAHSTCILVERESDRLQMWYQHIQPGDVNNWSIGGTVNIYDRLGATTTENGCDGNTTGHHVHISFKFNGQWIDMMGFSLNGWIVGGSSARGQSTLTKTLNGQTYVAYDNSNDTVLHSSAGDPPPPTRPTDTPVPAGQAKLYSEANFGGAVVWSGNTGFTNDPNANSYSLALPSGWSAKTWRGDNRSGEERCWSGSMSNLQDHGWQNAIQSIELFTYNACPTATATFTPPPTFIPTNTPRPPTNTPIPQSCTNPPPDRNVAYLFENENCVNPWNWASGHPSDGANRNAKSAWMPSGKVLLLSERNDGGEPQICLSSPVRNLADIGWGNRVEWAQVRDSCPIVQPTATPSGPKHEAKFYEEPNFARHTFSLNNPGTYRYSDLGHVDQFRKFYSVDLCSGCSIQLLNKRGDSICWGWDENNIGDHGDWPLVTVQIKFSYQNECPPREPSLQSPEEGSQFWEGDSVYVVWKDNDDPTSMYFTTEVRYGGSTIAQKYRTTDRSLVVTNLALGNYTIQSQSCSDLMCSRWQTRSFSVRMNPTATPTSTPTTTATATPLPTFTPTARATATLPPTATSTPNIVFPSRPAIPTVISPQAELVIELGKTVTFQWQPLPYPVEYLIYLNRNGIRVADSGGLRVNSWSYTFQEPGTYDWTISALCLGCGEYFSGFSQKHTLYAGGAPTATPTVPPLPSPTVTPTPTHASSCTLSIGQGAVFTGQLAVQIHTMVANAAEVQLSNDGGFSGAFWQPYADTINWTVSDPGQKIVTLLVYARFRDAAGNPLCNNSALTDDIIYDPLPPTVRIVALAPTNRTNGSATPPVAGVLTLAAEDQVGGSGVAEMRLGYQADLSALPWVSFRDVTQLDHIAGSTLFVEVRDGVGNRSVTVSRQFDMPGLLYLPLIKR